MITIPTGIRSRPVGLALGVLLGLGLLAGAVRAQTTSCPGSMPDSALDPEAASGLGGLLELDPSTSPDLPPALPKELRPNTTRKTPGEGFRAELDGPVILSANVPFSFKALDGATIEGTLAIDVVNAAHGRCVHRWQVHRNTPGSHFIKRLRIAGYTHPVHHLFADWRNDLFPGAIRSNRAHRSAGAGNNIYFDIDAGVGGNQDSRLLFLSSDVDLTHKTGTVLLEAEDGSQSAPIPTWVPKWP